MESPSFTFEIYPDYPPQLRQLVSDTVASIDLAFLNDPVYNERFDTAEEYLIRLQSYALSKGFAVMTLSHRATEAQFSCIYHADKPRNWGSLKDHVGKDARSFTGIEISERAINIAEVASKKEE